MVQVSRDGQVSKLSRMDAVNGCKQHQCDNVTSYTITRIYRYLLEAFCWYQVLPASGRSG